MINCDLFNIERSVEEETSNKTILEMQANEIKLIKNEISIN